MKRLIITIEFEDNSVIYALDRAKELINQGYTSGDLSSEDGAGWFEIEELEEEKDNSK